MERKLTAILSADVEGYSRLMGEDEEATIRTLNSHRQVMTFHIPRHRGRVVDSPGDNLLAEFGSVVDAVQCAVVIQTTLKAENANLPEPRRMEFRIGINLGDVMVDRERIYGDGVNIAARVEGLAEAGGICISGTVFDQIKNKVSVAFEDLGAQQVKNIAEPIRAYRAVLDHGMASAQPQKKSEAPRRQPPPAGPQEKVPLPEEKISAPTVAPPSPSVAGKEAGNLGLNDSLYTRTFVGRERELQQLQEAFDTALAGQGSLAMVVGEPGIGKTSLCEQLATYITQRGGKALVGHCYEEGSLSLPYLPFVESMRSYVLTREPNDLRWDLGSGAADVARLVSEIRDRLQIEVRPPGDPEEDRWRLLQAVSDFLRNASKVQPLLVVLEDLHDADRGTLDLLLHVSRNLHDSRLLIVGTYRDVEVDRAHPLSSSLAELRRARTFLRVPLRGLTVDEVHRMYCIIRGQEIPWSRAEAIHRQTEGNPLFVQEVLRYLVEEGIVVREGGRYSLADTEAGIPEGLRDVVGKRLSRLSEKANQVLSIAAVIGREFRLDVLQQVASLPEDELYKALEEATERAVIEQRQALGTVGFRFNHAFFRQTLYEETFVPRRIRLHQQVGKTLEEIYKQRLDEHAAELAEHFIQSTERGDLEKALAYSELAAKRAMQVFAYGEAVRHLQQALRTLEVLDPDDKAKHCDLLLTLAEALMPLGESKRVVESVAVEALKLAKTIGSDTQASRACRIALVGLQRYGGSTTWHTPEFRGWAEEADRYATAGTIDRVYADVALSYARPFGRPEESLEFALRAINLARQLNHPETLHYAGLRILQISADVGPQGPQDLALEMATWPRDGVSTFTLSRALYFGGGSLMKSGDRDGGERVWRELMELAGRTGDPYVMLRRPWIESILYFLDGRLDEAVEAAARLESRAAEVGSAAYGTHWGNVLAFRPLLYLGRMEEALAATEHHPSKRTWRRALIPAGSEHQHGVREGFKESVRHVNKGTSPHARICALEAAIQLRDMDVAKAMAKDLSTAEFGMGDPEQEPTCVARHLGDAAMLTGQADEARQQYSKALDFARKLRHRPEIALTSLSLAELLLDHYPDERADALQHLDFAINEFREMKMQPSLERAIGRKDLLKP